MNSWICDLPHNYYLTLMAGYNVFDAMHFIFYINTLIIWKYIFEISTTYDPEHNRQTLCRLDHTHQYINIIITHSERALFNLNARVEAQGCPRPRVLWSRETTQGHLN